MRSFANVKFCSLCMDLSVQEHFDAREIKSFATASLLKNRNIQVNIPVYQFYGNCCVVNTCKSQSSIIFIGDTV